MSREADNDDFFVDSIVNEAHSIVGVMTIKDEKMIVIFINKVVVSLFIKELDPVDANLTICPALSQFTNAL